LLRGSGRAVFTQALASQGAGALLYADDARV